MCGIAGYSCRGHVPRLDGMAHAMLVGIEPRGRDAAGIAWRDKSTGQVWICKAATRGSKFIESMGDGAPGASARTLIAHTRFATQGTPKENVNNHPVQNNGVVGIHNGVINNDDEIFAMLRAELGADVKRHGEVDSEAIFALLAYRKHLGYSVGECLSMLRGSYAIAWYEVGSAKDTLHLARGTGSPLWVGHTAKGSLLFASTEHALKEAAMAGGFRLVQCDEIPEGTYMKVASGKIVAVEKFEPHRYTYTTPNYNRPSKFAGGKVYKPTKGGVIYSKSKGKTTKVTEPGGALRSLRGAWYGTTTEIEAWNEYTEGRMSWDDYEDLRRFYMYEEDGTFASDGGFEAIEDIN